MTPNFVYIFLVLFVNNVVVSLEEFNFTAPYEHEGSQRRGKLFFDSFFGIDIEDQLLANAGTTNTLKSCDCGEFFSNMSLTLTLFNSVQQPKKRFSYYNDEL